MGRSLAEAFAAAGGGGDEHDEPQGGALVIHPAADARGGHRDGSPSSSQRQPSSNRSSPASQERGPAPQAPEAAAAGAGLGVGGAPGGPLELAEAQPEPEALPAGAQLPAEPLAAPARPGSSCTLVGVVGATQVVAGLLADGLGAAASAATTLLLEDGGLLDHPQGGPDNNGRYALFSGLGFCAWAAGSLGAVMLQHRFADEPRCLPARVIVGIASLALGASIGAALGARFLSHDEDLSSQVLTAAIARTIGFLIAEATLQALDRVLPKAELQAPALAQLALEGAADPVAPDALAQVVGAPPASWSHLGIGLATSLTGHFGTSPLARAVAGHGLDGGLGPRAASLFIEQLPLVLARALTRLHHAAQAARAVDASGLQVRLAQAPMQEFCESVSHAMAQSGARAVSGGAPRDLLAWLAAVAGKEPAWRHLFPLLQGLADQLGQAGGDRVSRVDLDVGAHRHVLVRGEDGAGDPRAYLEQHRVLYGGPDTAWRVRERAQVVELQQPEGDDAGVVEA